MFRVPDRSVVYSFIGRFDSLNAGLTTAGRNVQELGTKLTALDKNGARMRAGLDTLGRSAGRVGLIAAGGLAAATKAAMDWETAWTGVLKTVDGTPGELAELEAGLRGLARETGFAHQEVASVAEAAGQLGISTGGVKNFTRTMLDMGVSTNLSSEEAATGLARLRNIMGFTEGEIRNTGSAMVELGNNFATTEGEILAMSLRVAGAGRQAGLTTSDVLGLSTAMSSVGIEAEAGGTAISLTMKRIGKEVETGGDKLALFAETAGMSVEQFSLAWEEDAAGALTKFIAGLATAEERGTSTNAVLRELGVTGIREADALLRLSGNAEGLAEALDMSADGFRKNTALAEEAGKFYATSAQQVKQSWAEIKDAAIDAGAAMLPVVARAAETVGTLAGAFRALPDSTKSATSGLLGLTAVLGGGLWFTGKVVSGIADTKQALRDLGIAAEGTNGSIKNLAAKGGGLVLLTAALIGAAEAIERLNGGFDAGTLDRDFAALAGGDTTKNMQSMVEALETMRKAGSVPMLADLSGEVTTLFGALGNTNVDQAAEDIKQLDQYLASLVESGNADVAAQHFDALVAGLAELNHTKPERVFGDVVDMLDQYGTALDNAAGHGGAFVDFMDGLASDVLAVVGASKDGAAATDGFGSSMLDSAKAAAEEAAALRDSVDAMREKRSATLAAFDAETSYRQALKDAQEQAKKNTAGIKGSTDEALANRSALSQLAGAWNSQSNAVKNNVDRYRDARKSFIQTAEAMGVPTDAARKLANQILEIPKSRVAKIEQEGAEAATEQVRRLNAELAKVVSKRITVTANVIRNGLNSVLGGWGSADGSTVPKDGGPYDDRYLYMLAPGEEVISNRHGQADRHRPLLKAINAGLLADGGTAGIPGLMLGGTAHIGNPNSPYSPLHGLDQAFLSVRELATRLQRLGAGEIKALSGSFDKLSKFELTKLGKAMDIATKAIERQAEKAREFADEQREQLKALKDARREFANAVKSNFRTDIFGGSDLASLYQQGLLGADFQGQLDAFARQQIERERAAAEARGEEYAPQSFNTVDFLQEFIESLSAGQIGQFQAQASVNQLQQDQTSAGAFAYVLDQLRQMGLTGGAYAELAASGNYAQANAYLQLGPEFIKNFMADWKDRNQSLQNLGQSVGNAQFGADIREQRKAMERANRIAERQEAELREANRINRQLARHLEHIKDKAPKETGKAVADAVNSAVSHGQRRAH